MSVLHVPLLFESLSTPIIFIILMGFSFNIIIECSLIGFIWRSWVRTLLSCESDISHKSALFSGSAFDVSVFHSASVTNELTPSDYLLIANYRETSFVTMITQYATQQ